MTLFVQKRRMTLTESARYDCCEATTVNHIDALRMFYYGIFLTESSIEYQFIGTLNLIISEQNLNELVLRIFFFL